jgi:hypothetical protein
MAYDDPKLPAAVLRGKNLYVGDDREAYFRDSGHRLYLDVTDLSISGGFETDDVTPPFAAAADRSAAWRDRRRTRYLSLWL